MPKRSGQLSGRKRNFAAIYVAVILFAAISNQPLRAQMETSSTNSNPSGIAGKWQSAEEKGSNAWEDVKQGSVQAWESTKEGTSNAWIAVKTGTTQAWADVEMKFAPDSGKTNYIYEKKDEFVAQATAELNDLDQKIHQLSDKATNATASAKVEAQQKLQSIKAQRGYLNQKLNEAKTATKADWNEAQAGFQKAYENTKSSVKAAWDWLKSKTS